jgi:hypothetical protein
LSEYYISGMKPTPSLQDVYNGECPALCWAKEKAILELLATGENELDAVVQCGTNMSLIDVAEKLGPVTGIPIRESIR